MIKKEDSDFRPEYHFTPPGMWLNDPNGMVYIDGVYHLFYQHYPADMKWGPMHWGHAVSENLLDWEHLPIALYPDDSGFIFSGSCVYDRKNVSGFGKEGEGPLIALYTSHNPRNHRETQSLAYSTDFVNFEKYAGNPVIPNPGLRDFRDPKVFWNPVRKCWSLVLAADRSVFFYSSFNLKEWAQTGEFSTRENGAEGICECPDCLPIETEEGTKWVLIISMILETEGEKSQSWKTQYFLGDFDGDTFVKTEQSEGALWLNYGADHYAGVTFQNSPRPILMAWADNWAYARDLPTKDFLGQMSLACEMWLTKTEEGYRIRLEPIGPEPRKTEPIHPDGTFSFETRTFGLTAEGCGRIWLGNSVGEKLLIEVTEEEILIDRTGADKKGFSEIYGKHEYCRAAVTRYRGGSGRMRAFFDVSLLEVFADDGLTPVSLCVYPERAYNAVTVEGEMSVLFHHF